MGVAIESHGICAAIALVCCAGTMACGKDRADDSPALCQAGAMSCGCPVKGSFSASFTGEQVSGTFDAVACGAI
ncbi:MAG: hypothetical protein HY898_13710 [Deltaproteobacteria bacterium]|nr:hypothetical protein [Deltaproteobacteria bacterium]